MFHYYYVVYTHGDCSHAMIIRQRPSSQGFNIAGTQKMLFERDGSHPVILSWQETTEQRYEEWQGWANKIEEMERVKDKSFN